MAEGKAELITISNLLFGNDPDIYEIRKDRLRTGLWVMTIGAVESRLLLANALHNGDWLSGPKTSIRKTDKSLSLADLQQAIVLLDSHIIKHVSFPPSKKHHLPMREIYSYILSLKAKFCVDPSVKLLFQKVAEGIANKEPVAFPKVSAYGKGKTRSLSWYKYVSMYGALLGAVSFKDDALSHLKLDHSWLKQDECLVVILYTYALVSGASSEQWEKLLATGERSSSNLPNLTAINMAMKTVVTGNM
jgi:hypothetical protein